MAWLAHVDLDTGSTAFRGQGLRPSLRFVAEWDLPDDMSIGVMPGLVADKAEDGSRFTAGIFAVTLAKAGRRPGTPSSRSPASNWRAARMAATSSASTSGPATW
jgi:hypothetical protein